MLPDSELFLTATFDLLWSLIFFFPFQNLDAKLLETLEIALTPEDLGRLTEEEEEENDFSLCKSELELDNEEEKIKSEHHHHQEQEEYCPFQEDLSGDDHGASESDDECSLAASRKRKTKGIIITTCLLYTSPSPRD